MFYEEGNTLNMFDLSNKHNVFWWGTLKTNIHLACLHKKKKTPQFQVRHLINTGLYL